MRDRPQKVEKSPTPVSAGVPIELSPRRWRQSCGFDLVAGLLQTQHDSDDRREAPASEYPVVDVRYNASAFSLKFLLVGLEILMRC